MSNRKRLPKVKVGRIVDSALEGLRKMRRQTKAETYERNVFDEAISELKRLRELDAQKDSMQSKGNSLAFLERLYRLEDPRDSV